MLIAVEVLDAVKSKPNSPHCEPVPPGLKLNGSVVLPAVADTATGPGLCPVGFRG